MYQLANNQCKLQKEYVYGAVLGVSFLFIIVMLVVCFRRKTNTGNRYKNVLEGEDLHSESHTEGFSAKVKSLKYEQGSNSISEVHINPKQSMCSEQEEVETIVQTMSVKGSVHNPKSSVFSFKSHKV